jgi:hypothetical protein
MEGLIKKKDFAQLQGVTKGRVSQWLKAGIIQEIEGGLLDKEKAVAAIAAYRKKRFREPDPSTIDIDLKIDLSGLVKS